MRETIARITKLLAAAMIAGGCSGADPGDANEDVDSSRQAIQANWRTWSQQTSNANGFAGSPAICSAETGDSNHGPSGGYMDIGRDDDSNRFRISLYQFFTPPTAWADLGDQTFSLKPSCANFDELHQTDKTKWNNQFAVLGRSRNSNTYYIRVMKLDTTLPGPPSQPEVKLEWTRISTTAYESAPGATVAGGTLWVVGRLSDNSLKLGMNNLKLTDLAKPFDNSKWSFVAVPALPSPWVAQGDAAIVNTVPLFGFPTLVVRAKNSNTNAIKLYVQQFDGVHFFGWGSVSTGSIGVASDPAAEMDPAHGFYTIYFRGTDNKIYQGSSNDGVFSAIRNDTFVGDPSAIGYTPLEGGHIVSAKGSNGQFYHAGLQP